MTAVIDQAMAMAPATRRWPAGSVVHRVAAAFDPAVTAAVAIVTMLAYLPTMLATYGISDDYVDLVTSTSDNSTLLDVAISGGRPVSGLAQEVALSLATDVSSLRWLRVLGTLGVAATAVIAAAIARSLGAGRLAQWAVGIGVAAMPSSQVIASWAVLFPVSWGAAMALAAGFGLRAVRVTTIRDRTWLVATAIVAAVTAVGLANYQPSAMAFAPGLALALIDPTEQIRVRAHRALAGVVGAGLGGAVYLVVSRLLIRWRGVQADLRSSLELPGWSKLDWFVTDTLPRSLDPLSFQPRGSVAVATVLFIVVGLAIRPGPAWNRVLTLALAATSIVTSYLPTLVVADRWPSARSRLATDITVALLVGIAASSIVAWVRARHVGAARAATAAWACAVAASMIFASWRVTTYYTDPQSREYRAVAAAIDQLELPAGVPLVVVTATWEDPLAPAVDLDEFGFPSMATAWGPVGLVQIERLQAGQPLLVDITVISHLDPLPPDGVVVLDIHGLYERLP